MTHWDDLRTVLELVRHGTLSGAGQALGVSYTTVARRIARAEAALDARLFERLADGYRPTEAARLVAVHAAEMQVSEDALLRGLSGRDGRLSGPLTLTAPQLLIAHVLAPVLDEFTATYPDVDLQVRATNDILDLTRREADLALRVSREPGDTLKGLRLVSQDRAIFATQKWADRFADDPTAPLDWILFASYQGLSEKLKQAAPGARVRYRFDDMIALAGAVQAGLGAAWMPVFLGRALPGLVPLPVLPPQPYADIWLLAHPDLWSSAKVAALRTVMVRHLRASRANFVADEGLVDR